jgi:hypothetical protein
MTGLLIVLLIIALALSCRTVRIAVGVMIWAVVLILALA